MGGLLIRSSWGTRTAASMSRQAGTCAVLEVKKVAALLTVQSTVDVLLRVVSVMPPASTPGSGCTREGGLAANSGTGQARQEFGTGCGLSNRRVYASKQRFVSAWIWKAKGEERPLQGTPHQQQHQLPHRRRAWNMAGILSAGKPLN